MHSPSFWYPRSEPALSERLLKLTLSPIAALYAAGAHFRQRMTVPERLSVPVICIGNFTLGGAGKTPTAIAVAERLMTMGEVPHFVSRGYGGQEAGPLRVDASQHTSTDVGDEPLLLSRHCPAWVSQDRVAGALAAERAGASVILLDDGFQNPTLHKDLSVLVVDTGVGLGNGAVFPAGPLREPLTAALKRTHAIVALGTSSLSPDLVQLSGASGVPVLTANLNADTVVSDSVSKKRVVAFAGIGRPEKFFTTLQDLGTEIVETKSFADHHPFSEADARDLLTLAAENDAELITTEKDAVRLSALSGTFGQKLRKTMTALPVTAAFSDLAALDGLLEQHLKAARASHTYAPPGTRRA